MPAKYLVYDIETIPETETAKAWRDSPEYEADRRRQKCAEGEKPFPPHSCHKVISIGAMVLDEKLHVLKSGVLAGGAVEGDERAQVQRWNDTVTTKGKPLTLVDWNGKKFDAPVLQYRAFRYGIPMRWYFSKLPDKKGTISQWSKTYRDRFGGQHMDLVETWTNSGAFQKCHLKELAILMGLPGKTGIDGSQVHQAWKDDRKKEIDDYCLEDVWHTGFVFMRMRYLFGGLSKEGYLSAAEGLYNHAAETEGHESFIEKIDRKLLMLEA